MGIWAAYKRWRHTRGYGVHSPFAYRLVTDVLRLGGEYEYYGYDEIAEALTSADPRGTRHRARILLRLAARFNVASAYLADGLPMAYLAALRAADSRMHFASRIADGVDCRLIVSSSEMVPMETLAEFLKRPDSILFLVDMPRNRQAALFDALPEGIMFYSRTALIAVHRPETAKVAYSVRL